MENIYFLINDVVEVGTMQTMNSENTVFIPYMEPEKGKMVFEKI